MTPPPAPPPAPPPPPPPLDETLFDELKRYVRFDDGDARAVASAAPIMRPHFERVAHEFYARIREHGEAHAVLADESQVRRLHGSLVLWMERLFGGVYDEAYFEARAKIGRVHVRVGLPQRYMFTAMALIRDAFERALGASGRADADRVRTALGRLLDLELAIMLETYREDVVARLQRVERLERDRLEQALARSEEIFASAIEHANAIVVALDGEGAVRVWNREAERVSGYASDEMIGERFAVRMLAEESRGTEGAELEAMARGTAPLRTPLELAVRVRSGRSRTLQLQLARVPGGGSSDVSMVVVGVDVTDRRAEEEKRRREERLAAVGTLAAGLAHEIRNPLNGALLHVTFLERALRRSAPNPDADEAVRFVGDELRRLSALVTDFLVFARPKTPELREQSLLDVCRRSLEALRADAASAKVELRLDAPVDVVIAVDAGKIEQVLINLLRNAVEAVQSTGGGKVELRLVRLPRAARIEVEDDGPGLPSPDAPVFDAFFSTKPQGTGLGLAIVHRIVSDHGGIIEVSSAPGRTVFRITLPMRELPVEESVT